MNSPVTHIRVLCRRSFCCIGCGCRYHREFLCVESVLSRDGLFAVDRAVEDIREEQHDAADQLPCPECHREPSMEQIRRRREFLFGFVVLTVFATTALGFLVWHARFRPEDGLAFIFGAWLTQLILLKYFEWRAWSGSQLSSPILRAGILGGDRLIVEPRGSEPIPPDPTRRIPSAWRLSALGFAMLAAAPLERAWGGPGKADPSGVWWLAFMTGCLLIAGGPIRAWVECRRLDVAAYAPKFEMVDARLVSD
jgi:hypothetical protein